MPKCPYFYSAVIVLLESTDKTAVGATDGKAIGGAVDGISRAVLVALTGAAGDAAVGIVAGSAIDEKMGTYVSQK
jgi:outer membrane lipoprotein SlyB